VAAKRVVERIEDAIATAPKSNATYTAFGAAMRTAKAAGSLLPPKHILNARPS